MAFQEMDYQLVVEFLTSGCVLPLRVRIESLRVDVSVSFLIGPFVCDGSASCCTESCRPELRGCCDDSGRSFPANHVTQRGDARQFILTSDSEPLVCSDVLRNYAGNHPRKFAFRLFGFHLSVMSRAASGCRPPSQNVRGNAITKGGLALRSLRSGGNNIARPAVFRILAAWRRAWTSFCAPTHTPLPRGVGCIITPRPQKRDGAFWRVVAPTEAQVRGQSFTSLLCPWYSNRETAIRSSLGS